MNQHQYWSWLLDDGEIYDAEFEGFSEARDRANELYAEQIKESFDDLHDGEFHSKDTSFVLFQYNDDLEKVIVSEIEIEVSYEHQQPDHIEHSTY